MRLGMISAVNAHRFRWINYAACLVGVAVRGAARLMGTRLPGGVPRRSG